MNALAGSRESSSASTVAARGASEDTLVIYSGPLSMFGAKTEMAAIEKGIAWQRRFVPFSIAKLYEPRSPEVLRINPKGQVPVLVHGDLEIFDSTQIFEYLEDLVPTPPLWPKSTRDRARARRLELESDEVFFPDVVVCMPARRAAAGEEAHARAVAGIRQYFERMDALLADREYLASEFGYADIAFYAAQFFARFLGQPPSGDLAHLERWRVGMNRRESVRAVMGEIADYLTDNGLETYL